MDWIFYLGLPLLAFMHCYIIHYILKSIHTHQNVLQDIIKYLKDNNNPNPN